MKLTPKGIKILGRLKDFYGVKKGKEIFLKMISEGKLTEVEIKQKRKKK